MSVLVNLPIDKFGVIGGVVALLCGGGNSPVRIARIIGFVNQEIFRVVFGDKGCDCVV